MDRVELSGRERFTGPLKRDFSLECLQFCKVVEPELVNQNVSVGIAIRVCDSVVHRSSSQLTVSFNDFLATFGGGQATSIEIVCAFDHRGRRLNAFDGRNLSKSPSSHHEARGRRSVVARFCWLGHQQTLSDLARSGHRLTVATNEHDPVGGHPGRVAGGSKLTARGYRLIICVAGVSCRPMSSIVSIVSSAENLR